MKILRPDEVVSSIFQIDYERLLRSGKRAIIFDLDNTLGPRKSTQLEAQVLALLDSLKGMGFHVGILTNRRNITNNLSINRLAEDYPLVHRASKPARGGFLFLLDKLDALPKEAVMVGDRIFTDIFGANRLGIYSIRICST